MAPPPSGPNPRPPPPPPRGGRPGGGRAGYGGAPGPPPIPRGRPRPGASARRRPGADGTGQARARIPWRSGLAWQVSLFFGLQSLGFYATIAWLPSVLRDNGIGAREAGLYLFGFQVLGLLALNAVPLLPRALAAPRVLAAAASLLNVASLLLLAVVPGLAPLAVVGIGIGAGICLMLAMSFQSERAADAAGAAALAGMAQSVGYLVAAAGPVLLGLLHAATGGWAPALVVLALLTAAQATVGYGAGRERTVALGPPGTPRPGHRR